MKVHCRSPLAHWTLPRKHVAVTLGNHVFTRLGHLEESILRHEAVHVRQWKRHGLLRFAVLYLWFHVRYGYRRTLRSGGAVGRELAQYQGEAGRAPGESRRRVKSRMTLR